jgi:lipopolysaccharide transport system ATP-binding protein
MGEIAIRVENLGKQYRIGQRHRYHSLRESLARSAAAPVRWLHSAFSAKHSSSIANGTQADTVWALKDVSFEVRQGEVMGIIGRNGAGKSTLLKILSRITEPTRGEIDICGRVGSLLEVGTGFHPELTGRENIYLNGAILGMKRAEIARKFDEIIAFAEIDKFLDTAVKHYSSGMYMRLAFSVAAHLDPEILLVDEVLAVGDAPFQKKCLGKMGEVAKGGRTVLFVSHHMPSVTRLCGRGLLLDDGGVLMDSDIYSVSSKYLQSHLGTSAERRWPDPDEAPGDSVARLKAVRVLVDEKVTDTVDIRSPVTIEMEFWNLKSDVQLVAAFSFFNDQGVMLFVSPDFHERRWATKPRPVGVYRSRCIVPGNFFAEGQIRIVAEVATRHPFYQIHFLEHDSVAFQVVETNEPGSVRAGWGRPIPGVVRPMLNWETDYVEHFQP